jgi:cytochrome c nitrite reductase small subunit
MQEDAVERKRDDGRTRWRALALVAGLTLGLGAFTFHYAEGLSYFSHDPAACVNCHIMRPQFESWLRGSHHQAAGCVDCHLPVAFLPKWLAKASNGWHHSKGFTLQNFHEPILIKPGNSRILQENCLRCHGELVHALLGGARTDADAVSCVHCHAAVGHGETTGLGGPDTADQAERTNP